MDSLLSNIKLSLPESTYCKDPQTSDLGRRIVSKSIELIDKYGFEDFTFKKLGTKIKSNESSIYRYFKNKHQLLVYLSCWYWAWLEYSILFQTNNLEEADQKLAVVIDVLVHKQLESHGIFDVPRLQRIMIHENGKFFLTQEVDEENKKGYFTTYKGLINRIALYISEKSPKYRYSKNLASLVVESSMYQSFLLEHFSSITDAKSREDIREFLNELLHKTLD